MLIFAILAVGALAMELSGARREVQRLQRRLREPSVGQFIPTFHATDNRGNVRRVAHVADSTYQIVFAFSENCAYCAASAAAWRALIDSSLKRGLDVIGITFDSLEHAEAYLATNGLRTTAVPFPDRKLALLSRITVVPVTLVLTSEGQIVWSRVGVLDQPGLDSAIGIVIRSSSGRSRPKSD